MTFRTVRPRIGVLGTLFRPTPSLLPFSFHLFARCCSKGADNIPRINPIENFPLVEREFPDLDASPAISKSVENGDDQLQVNVKEDQEMGYEIWQDEEDDDAELSSEPGDNFVRC